MFRLCLSYIKILPELCIDYTPTLTIPYQHLPADLQLWEEMDSWLLDDATKYKIKEAGGTLVAKCLEKEKRKSTITWRISLNSAPVMQKIITYFENLKPKVSVKKVIRMIKDIKRNSLEGDDKDFLKSYNVRQALFWCVHENPSIATEKDLIISVLHKILEFYKKKFFPSFLEPKRNLTFKLANKERLDIAFEKVWEIQSNLVKCLDMVKDVQEKQREGVTEVRNTLSLFAPIFRSQEVAKKILQKALTGLNWGFQTLDGSPQVMFQIG